MTTDTAERTTQALAEINELIKAIAGVQELIKADVKSPFCPTLTQGNLGRAYHNLSEMLLGLSSKGKRAV